MDNIMDKIKNTKILGICGNALLAVGTLLPLVSVTVFGVTQSVNYISGDGFFVFILALVSLAMIFANKLSEKVPFFAKLVNPKLTLIPTAISAILLIITSTGVSSASSELSSQLGISFANLANVGFGFGFYVMIIGLIAAAAYPFLYKGE